jgi:pyrroline-5-carboxylate reductase
LFDSLGATLECDTEAEMTLLMVPTCTMGPFYALLQSQQDWLVRQGIRPEDASYFVGRTYKNLADEAFANCKDPTHFGTLVRENTPGGINEQAIRNLRGMGVFAAYDAAMDGIVERICGTGTGVRTSDGTT